MSMTVRRCHHSMVHTGQRRTATIGRLGKLPRQALTSVIPTWVSRGKPYRLLSRVPMAGRPWLVRHAELGKMFGQIFGNCRPMLSTRILDKLSLVPRQPRDFTGLEACKLLDWSPPLFGHKRRGSRLRPPGPLALIHLPALALLFQGILYEP